MNATMTIGELDVHAAARRRRCEGRETTATANVVTTVLLLERVGWLDGVTYLTVRTGGDGEYDAYKALPPALEFEGKICGKSCFNSDNGETTYRSDKPVGNVVDRIRLSAGRGGMMPQHDRFRETPLRR